MSNLERKSQQVAVAASRVNALMQRLQQQSGKPLVVREKPSRLVYLALDISESMSGEKLTQAKAGALGFAKDASAKDYGVGLISFNDDATLLVEARTGASLAPSNLESLNAAGRTNMAAAIQVACGKLKNKPGDKVICIVSDGEADRETTFRARDEARAVGVEIMTLGVDGADMEFLNALATRKDLSVHVPTSKLQIGMQSMAKLLPG